MRLLLLFDCVRHVGVLKGFLLLVESLLRHHLKSFEGFLDILVETVAILNELAEHDVDVRVLRIAALHKGLVA